jgi:ribosome recycling factor
MNISNPVIKDLFEEYEFNSDATIESLVSSYKQTKAGRANPYILDNIKADYYGTPTPLNQLGNIVVAEARVLMINVWDIGAIKAIEKAILAANIGISPTNDGKVIRLIFPELTEEKRRDLVKDIKNQLENCKIVLRNHRRDINDKIKKMKKDNTITEDEQSTYEKEVDKIMNTNMEKVDKIFKDKEKEILSV